MAKNGTSQKKIVSADKEDRFDFLACLMKEGFDDVRKEIKETENQLRTDIRELEDRLQYRIAKVSTDLYHHLDSEVDPKIENHERRIKKLENARASF